jgi:hypothetical protein
MTVVSNKRIASSLLLPIAWTDDAWPLLRAAAHAVSRNFRYPGID